MTDDELKAIEKRAAKATHAPWESVPFIFGRYRIRAVAKPLGDALWQPSVTEEAKSNDADFIAHAREDVPKLVAEVRRLQSELYAAQMSAAFPSGGWGGV